MLYTFVKYFVRSALVIYCRKIIFTNRNLLNTKGPLLLACNHPNSFFDAILLGAFFKQPVHFLARGDAFKKPFAKRVLTALKLIPIYRLKEGKEYLALNDATFERCAEILTAGGIVLIFSEGLCENKWSLRQLKKGSARIALNAWKQPGIAGSFRILPASLNYSTFTRFRKRVIIDFGIPIVKSDIIKENEGEQIVELNRLIYTRLEKGLLIEEEDSAAIQFLLTNTGTIKGDLSNAIACLKEKQKVLSTNNFKQVFRRLTGTKKVAFNNTSFLLDLALSIILLVPAFIGLITHLPFYLPLNTLIKKKTQGTVFYHSALFVVSMLIYPFYLLTLAVILIVTLNDLFLFATLILMPASALVFLAWNDRLEKVVNHVKLSKGERLLLQKSS